jgi:hypothetical protein
MPRTSSFVIPSGASSLDTNTLNSLPLDRAWKILLATS